MGGGRGSLGLGRSRDGRCYEGLMYHSSMMRTEEFLSLVLFSRLETSCLAVHLCFAINSKLIKMIGVCFITNWLRVIRVIIVKRSECYNPQIQEVVHQHELYVSDYRLLQ
jgi:hypothetical protein